MPTVAQHAKDIIDFAGQADSLIEQLRPVLESIAAAEAALYLEAVTSGKPVNDALAGRRRLAEFAQGRVFKPQFSQTVTELATAAWQGVA